MKFPNQTALNKALITAAADGRIQDVAGLLRQGAQVNGVDDQLKSALRHAVDYGHTDIFKLLLQSGADPHAKDIRDDTALISAAGNHRQDIVDELIKLQVDVNAVNTTGSSALSLADNHPDIVRSLLDAKADVTLEANRSTVLNAVLLGSPKVAQMLVEAGGTPNAINWNGKATLTLAVEKADAGLVRSLVEAKADPNHGANQQALASALASPAPGVLQVLLDAGARPDLSQHAGRVALFHAIDRGHADVLKQWLPVMQAALCEHIGWNPLRLAVQAGKAEIVGILRDAGYGIDLVDERGTTVLMYASHLGDPAVVQSLLQPRSGQPGADPNFQSPDDGKTALMIASVEGRGDAMKCLLAAGADPNASDHFGRGVLVYADGCIVPEHKPGVQSIIVEAIAARALETAAQLRLPYSGFDDLCERHEEHAADGECSAGDSDQSAWADWTEMMNDIDASPVETVASGGTSTLPYLCL